MLSEMSDRKDKYGMLSHVESKNENKQTNIQNRNWLRHIENKLVVTSTEREGRRGKIGIWD